MSKTMLRDLSAATDLKHVVLRYFNVAGSDPDGRIGQSTPETTLLIKVAAEVALGLNIVIRLSGLCRRSFYRPAAGPCRWPIFEILVEFRLRLITEENLTGFQQPR